MFGRDSIKIIMNRIIFLLITRYLHVCDTDKQVSRYHPQHDILLNLREFYQTIEHKFKNLFVPENFLILDASPVC